MHISLRLGERAGSGFLRRALDGKSVDRMRRGAETSGLTILAVGFVVASCPGSIRAGIVRLVISGRCRTHRADQRCLDVHFITVLDLKLVEGNCDGGVALLFRWSHRVYMAFKN